MVARTVIAVGVGLIAATTWAAEPLRFVTEPGSAAMPLPAEASAARPIAPDESDDVRPVPSRPSSRRLQNNPPPVPVATDDRELAAEEVFAEPEIPAPARVLPSTRKTKVITVVRPKKPSEAPPSPDAIERLPARAREEPAPLPMASSPAPKPRLLAPPTTARGSQPTPLARGNATAQPRPKSARKAARIAVTPDEQTAGNFAKPAPVKTRHLLSPAIEASKPSASDVADTPAPKVRAEKPTARRRVSAAEEEQEAAPLEFAASQPAPLADELSMALQRPAAPAEDSSAQAAEAFRFRLSDEGATSAARAASAGYGASLESSSQPDLKPRPALEFRTAQKSPAAPRTLAGSESPEPASSRSPAAQHQVPLALRLDALHSKPAKAAAKAAPKAEPDEVASLEGIAPDRAASRPAAAPRPRLQSVTARPAKPLALPAEVAHSAAPSPAQAAAPAVKGSVVYFDRTQQTVRLLFSGTEPPPVGTMIKVQHTSYFGANEFTTLRVVRVESGEVLARPTTNERLQRLSRGDMAFYRPAPDAEGSTREASVARAPMTARETVWK